MQVNKEICTTIYSVKDIKGYLTKFLKLISQLKTNKSPGPNEIYLKIRKLIIKDIIDLLGILCNQFHDTGQIPKEWLESIFIPIPKPLNVKNCSDYRLGLMSQTLKNFY